MRKLIVIIVVAVVFFAAGWGYSHWSVSQTAQKGTNSEIVKLDLSNLVHYHSMLLQGNIASISGDKITLTDGGNSFTFTIPSNAEVNRIVAPSGSATTTEPANTEKISLSDLAAGDQISLVVTVGSDGAFNVTNVTLIPQPTSQTTNQ